MTNDFIDGWNSHIDYRRDLANKQSAGSGWDILWFLLPMALLMVVVPAIMAAFMVDKSVGETILPHLLAIVYFYIPVAFYAFGRAKKVKAAAHTAFETKWEEVIDHLVKK